MAQKHALIVGIFLAGCAGEVESVVAPTDPARVAPSFSEPCALSPVPRTSSTPPRIFVELATLEGDLASIQQPNAAAGGSAAAPRTFAQMLEDPRWKAITVRNVIASDGVRQTFPWDFEPPRTSTGCPVGEGWELNLTPHVIGRSPVMVRVQVQVLPAPPAGVAPDAWHVPLDCGARTTLIVHDQEVVVLSGFPKSAGERGGVMTTVTPYVLWDDTDLLRLAECKGKHAQTNARASRSPWPEPE